MEESTDQATEILLTNIEQSQMTWKLSLSQLMKQEGMNAWTFEL
jgi:hypothetical protein